MCTVSIISSTVSRINHTQVLPGVGVGVNCYQGCKTGVIENTFSISGFATAHTASTGSISGFCTADTARTSCISGFDTAGTASAGNALRCCISDTAIVAPAVFQPLILLILRVLAVQLSKTLSILGV